MLSLMAFVLLKFWQQDMCVICGFTTYLWMSTLRIKVICGSITVSTFHSVVSTLVKVYIIEGSNDGWNIDSIVTLVGAGGHFQVLTQDLDVNRWIKGDGHHTHRRFELTFA